MNEGLRLVRQDAHPAKSCPVGSEGGRDDCPPSVSTPTSSSEDLLVRMQLHYLYQALFTRGLITAEAMDREDRAWSWLLKRRDLEVKRARSSA